MLRMILIGALTWGGLVGATELIYNTATGERLSLNQFGQLPRPGDVFVLGEQHAISGQENDPATIQHHANQTRLLQTLTARASAAGFHVTTGMEFLTYTDQQVVDEYVTGRLDETSFIEQSGWSSGNPFQFYRNQILAPRLSGGRTLALNIPRAISGQVAKDGPDSLSAEQRALLPPVWELGRSDYFDRFSAEMRDHVPAEAITRYFWAQSLWDDTMAWNTVKNLAADPAALTVIIVGEFHVQYGQGLPSRLSRQGARAVRTLLQVQVDSMDQLPAAVAPDPKYGAAADFLWVHTLN